MATIRKLSSNKFRAEIRSKQNFIKSKTFSNQADAKIWAVQIDQNVESILNIKSKKLKNISPSEVESLGGLALFHKLGIDIQFMTFSKLSQEYMLQWTGKDKNQLSRASYWMTVFKDTPVKKIKTKHIRKAIDTLASTGMFARDGSGEETEKKRSSNTVIRYKSVLSAIFNYAIQKGYIKLNPVSDVYVKPTVNRKERYLTECERKALLNACKESTWDKLYLLVIMAITTGMRKSELIHLRWADIDFDRNLAVLEDTKNGETRLNPLTDVVMEELKKFRKSDNQLIFHSPTKPEKPFSFRKSWHKALNIAGVSSFRFHDLRHTSASYLVMAGATLYETGEILGHRSTETTKRYAHLSTAHKSQLSERIMGNIT